MNIEIANRLVGLRKGKGLSQEQLAEKIGVSRQAVSKWERSEASPDTDNLIMLARLYEISLDELLRTEDEIPMPEAEEKAEPPEPPAPDPFPGLPSPFEAGKAEETREDQPAEAESPAESPAENSASTAPAEITAVSEDSGAGTGTDDAGADVPSLYERIKNAFLWKIPVLSVCVIMFLGMTIAVPGGVKVGWFFLLLVPVIFSAEAAVKKRDPFKFLYPVLAAGIFLLLLLNGDSNDDFSWLIFLTIPLYYWVCGMARHIRLKPPAEKPEKPMTAFRRFLYRYSTVVDVVILFLGMTAAFYISMEAANYGRICESTSVIALLAIPVVQSLFHSLRDSSLKSFAFGVFICGVYISVCTADPYSVSYSGMHWILIIVPLYNMLSEMAERRRNRPAEPQEKPSPEEVLKEGDSASS